jgi:hypothetical protein
MVDVDQGEGYSIVLEGGKVQVNLVKIKGKWLVDDFTPLTGDTPGATPTGAATPTDGATP